MGALLSSFMADLTGAVADARTVVVGLIMLVLVIVAIGAVVAAFKGIHGGDHGN